MIKKLKPAQALIKISEKKNLQELLERFLDILKRNGQLPLVYEILKKYENLAREEKEGAEAILSVALPENQDEISKLVQQIKVPGIKKIRTKIEIDRNLIGGFVLRINDILIDASIKKKINDLKKHLIEK